MISLRLAFTASATTTSPYHLTYRTDRPTA